MLMPVIIRFKGYRFFFFSNEEDPREPIHIYLRQFKSSRNRSVFGVLYGLARPCACESKNFL